MHFPSTPVLDHPTLHDIVAVVLSGFEGKKVSDEVEEPRRTSPKRIDLAFMRQHYERYIGLVWHSAIWPRISR